MVSAEKAEKEGEQCKGKERVGGTEKEGRKGKRKRRRKGMEK